MNEAANDEEMYGPLYRFSQHKRGETIKYRVPGFDHIYVGQVLYVQAPARDVAGHNLPMRYVVHCAERDFIDSVFETDLVRE